MADEDVEKLLHQRRYESAFEILLSRYQKRVFHLAYSILRESAKAEEVAQDAFAKLWQGLHLYDGRASLSTWLYTIARNTALSAARAESRRRTMVLQTDDMEEFSASDKGLENIELRQLIERLPEVQQQVIMLFYFEDHSVEDVADMLDLPEGTVKSHLHRARRTLAQWLKGSGQL
jgi:RNA polymerase sigma-70 factor (ECF subfamily)